MRTVEMRCPSNPSRLLGKVNDPRPGEPVIELSCDHCRRSARRTRPDVVRVLHRFDTDGSFDETVTVYLETDHA